MSLKGISIPPPPPPTPKCFAQQIEESNKNLELGILF